jgi:hypothetical protein
MTSEFKISELQVDKGMADSMFKGSLEAHLCFQIHVLFENILKDLRKSLKEKSAFYFWKYDSPNYNEYTGELEDGESRLFSFIWHLLLAEEIYDYENYDSERMRVGHKSFTELNESEIEKLNKFVLSLSSFVETKC